MSNIIPFRTREELEKEKLEAIKDEWEEWEEFEKAFEELMAEGKLTENKNDDHKE